MSETAHSLSKTVRRLCRSCAEPPSRSTLRRPSTPCFECYRAERDRRRAQRREEVPAAQLLPLTASRSLSERELAHRRRMLAHLGATRLA